MLINLEACYRSISSRQRMDSSIGPLQLAIHVVQNYHAGEQKSHWDNTNKGNYHLNYVFLLFVLSQCDFCTPAWRFCTTWMANCEGPSCISCTILTVSRKSKLSIECFHPRGQHLCKFIRTKESVCIRKEFNSHRIGLGHQHGRRFIVLEHQYGRRDVMWKHSIRHFGSEKESGWS